MTDELVRVDLTYDRRAFVLRLVRLWYADGSHCDRLCTIRGALGYVLREAERLCKRSFFNAEHIIIHVESELS